MKKRKNLITETLKDFNVKTEDELIKKLDRESQTVPCFCCGNETPIDKISFIDGDPYCHHCAFALE